MTSISLLAAVVLAACSATPHTSMQSPSTVRNGTLVGPNEMTLYVFEKDATSSGKSVCHGGCATNWPPLMAPATATPFGDWSVVMRDDGAKQWAYKGRPLYFWAKDAKVGDQTGEGMAGNSWHVAKP